MYTMPARDTVAGDALARCSTSRMSFMVGAMGTRSPLARVSTYKRREKEGVGPPDHLLPSLPPLSLLSLYLVVVQHSIQVLDPDGVDGAVEHDPGVLRARARGAPPQRGKHAVRPVTGGSVHAAKHLRCGNGLEEKRERGGDGRGAPSSPSSRCTASPSSPAPAGGSCPTPRPDRAS
jgi:hypothetical protein